MSSLETWVSAQVTPPFEDRATKALTTSPEFTPATVLPGGRSGEYAGSALESLKTTVRTPSAEPMSGNHWWPTGTVSILAGAVGQVTPSGELRTKILDWPAGVSAA